MMDQSDENTCFVVACSAQDAKYQGDESDENTCFDAARGSAHDGNSKGDEVIQSNFSFDGIIDSSVVKNRVRNHEEK